MNRMQFFQLLERGLQENIQTGDAMYDNAGNLIGGKKVGTKLRALASQTGRFVSKNKSAFAKGAAGVATTVGGLMMLRKKLAGKAPAAAPSRMSQIAKAVKGNPKKALAAGGAGLAAMMFMRKKSKKNKK